MEPTDFGWALEQMRQGRMVSRAGWNWPYQWIAIQSPDENSMMERPYIYICPADGHYVPWVASQTDLLADDWEIFPSLTEGSN